MGTDTDFDSESLRPREVQSGWEDEGPPDTRAPRRIPVALVDPLTIRKREIAYRHRGPNGKTRCTRVSDTLAWWDEGDVRTAEDRVREGLEVEFFHAQEGVDPEDAFINAIFGPDEDEDEDTDRDEPDEGDAPFCISQYPVAAMIMEMYGGLDEDDEPYGVADSMVAEGALMLVMIPPESALSEEELAAGMYDLPDEDEDDVLDGEDDGPGSTVGHQMVLTGTSVLQGMRRWPHKPKPDAPRFRRPEEVTERDVEAFLLMEEIRAQELADQHEQEERALRMSTLVLDAMSELPVAAE